MRGAGASVAHHARCCCSQQEKGIDEAFWPIFQLDEAPAKGKGSHWAVRIGMGLALGGAIWALHAYVPDKGARCRVPHA